MSVLCQLQVLAAAAATVSTRFPASAAQAIARGQIHVEPDFLPPALVRALRKDATELFKEGKFTPDGLTNTAVTKSEQGFTRADRQTFRGDGWTASVGDKTARLAFAQRMLQLRRELAVSLDRPSLAPEGVRKHEMTYNWYEPGAGLGRHLDEHHEETKGVKGWRMPTRRSVTWLVYLNEDWAESDGGSLRSFPRAIPSAGPVGADDGNLQVGWLGGRRPVFLDSWRPDARSALYVRDDEGAEVLSADFEVPRPPVDFGVFLRTEHRKDFEQISTARLDPRFASAIASAGSAYAAAPSVAEFDELYHRDVIPTAGTLVVFDSVSLPHLVKPVTGSRTRVAATGWFHEDLVTRF